MTTNEPPRKVLAPPNGERIVAHVVAHHGHEIALAFEEIEAITGEPLPMAWRTHADRWSGDGTKHTILRLLHDAGWRARLDHANRRVIFRREDA
jgi:hypothetical protein